MTEEEYRGCLAWLKASATDDGEGLEVVANTCDMRQLADDLSELCLVLLRHFGDPLDHIDRMFRAADMARRGR